MNKITLLQTTKNNFVKAPPPSNVLVGGDATKAWFAQHAIVFPAIFTCNGNAIGFKKDGVEAVIALAEGFLNEHRNFARTTDFQKFVLAVANERIKAIQNGAAHEDYSEFERNMTAWFFKEAVPRTHYIPCSISPYQSQPFKVGPVIFQTVNSFKSSNTINLNNELDSYGYDKLFKFAAEQGANWMAEIKIEGYDQTRSSELADLSTDIALTALQLIIPSSSSREISRSTARTIPRYMESFNKVGEHLAMSCSRHDPCLGYAAEYFDLLLREQKSLLDSVGQRVNSFISNKSVLPNLDQAWCDAAYWFHEGISERLDTIAITKMEASIEVLLFAESSQGSKDRLHKAFQAIYGLDGKQPWHQGNPRTVTQFIESIVTARSRILHGTWSTLTHRPLTLNEHQHREEVEMLARDLLIQFTLHLDKYKIIENPNDDVKGFLEWIAKSKGNPRKK